MRPRTMVLLGLWLAPLGAEASFHLTKVREVYAGGGRAGSNVQYVMLQAYAAGENFVGGHQVTIYNAAGTLIPDGGTLTFPGSVPNGASQATILVATAAAGTYFGVTPDLVMPAAVISAGGGKVCFDAIPVDCVTWGNFTGSTTGAGPPFGPDGGIPAGFAIRRRIDRGTPTILDVSDDTDNCADDFRAVTPVPITNPGVQGSVPVIVVLNLNDTGAGSLRQAITNANVDAVPDTITFTAGLQGSVSLASELPALVSPMSIVGPGADKVTVQRTTGGDYRIFTVSGGVSVSISNLTIANGNAAGDSGGGVFANNADGGLTLSGVVLQGNQGKYGGGVASSGGELTVSSCTIQGNVAEASGEGGGFYVSGGHATFSDTTIAGNAGPSGGGGIDSAGGGGTMVSFNRCTLSGNTATESGSALRFSVTGTPATTVSLSNSTVSGNSGGTAAIVVSATSAAAAVMNLSSVTLNGNTGSAAGSIENTQGQVNLENTLLGGDGGPMCSGGGITSRGHNLAQSEGDDCGLGATGDLMSLDPQLEALAQNGGSTATHALGVCSPAINSGTNAPTGGLSSTDQRGIGFSRIVGGTTDIGALEAPAASITSQPTGQTLFAGGTISLSVTASRACSYQWRKGGVDIGGATSGTFTKGSATSDDSGSYDVVVVSAAGNVTSNAVTVTVNGPPSITTQPQDQTIFATQQLTLSVLASGVGLSYQWRKDGQEIGGATSSTFTKIALLSDAGSYDVVVTNGAGSVASSAATVTVNGPPSIDTQPSGQVLFAGDTVSLTVSASGVGLTYQWRKGGTAVNGATAATFTKQSATTADSGSYDVVVTNGAGSVLSNSVVVTVHGPPSITTQPSPQTLFNGETISLTVVASGEGLSYQWRKDTVAIGGATSATFSKANALTVDSGTYDVVVSNAAGSVTSTGVLVTVNGPPAISTQPTNQTVFATQPLTLSVTALGAGLGYQWRKGGSPITGATSASYSVASAAASDAGSYDVVVSNPAGSVTSNAVTVTVNGPPSITSSPGDQTLSSGQTLTLQVTASGAGLTYAWRKNGVAIAGAIAATFSKANINTADGGTYDVVVSNPAGSATSAAALVTVNGPPTITAHPQSQSVFAAETLHLSVSAAGAALTYQWRKDLAPIAGATASTYEKVETTVADSGSYDVVVSNSAGSVTSNPAVVVVNGPPVIVTEPAPQTLFATQTLTLSVTAAGQGLGFQWRKNGDALALATASTYTKANATADDSGSYDVVVTNNAGSVASSAVTVVVQGPPVITAEPADETLRVGDALLLRVTATGADLVFQWRKDGAPLNGATSFTYSVTAVALSDAGSYDVQISNPAGTVTSRVAVVGVEPLLPDAGASADAGVGTDGGGVHEDGGAAADGGVDAGVTPPRTEASGCGCATEPSGQSPLLATLALFLALRKLRRRTPQGR